MSADPRPGAFPYRLIATDLDGTLLRSDETISPRTRAALSAACAAGADHLVATGRSVALTRHILDALDYRGLAVCGQGAQLYHAGEHRLLTSVTLDRRLARRVVETLEKELGPLAFAANRDGLEGEVLFDARYRLGEGSGLRAEPGDDGRGDGAPGDGAEPAQAGPLAARAVDRAPLWAEPLIKLYVQHPELSDDELAAAVRGLAGDAVTVVVSGPGLVELLPSGLSKATGLSLAARRLGARAAQTIAFGDMPNDIPMLAWAAHGVAMAGAHPEVRAAADEVTAGNDADGVAEVLERLLAAG